MNTIMYRLALLNLSDVTLYECKLACSWAHAQ